MDKSQTYIFQALIMEKYRFHDGGEACRPSITQNKMEPIREDSLERDDHVVLSLLEEIEKNPQTSQRQLARQVGVAVGLVNAFLKRVISKGYVTASRINSRNVHYLLTPHGILEKSRLTYKYLRYSLRYVWLYRQKVHELLAPYADGKNDKVVIYGSGEEAELAYLTICELGMKLEAIVDPERVGNRCVGYEIQDHTWLDGQESIEILVFLHYVQKQENFNEITNIVNNNEKVKLSLKINF